MPTITAPVAGSQAYTSSQHVPLRPPDLIIRDEPHLISGALGTLVGLYENVVDRLCTWEVNGQAVRPKVIAATATIRHAPQQVKALFRRNVEVFPPNGLDVTDTYPSLPASDSYQQRLQDGATRASVRRVGASKQP